jgi:hypothetical protein
MKIVGVGFEVDDVPDFVFEESEVDYGVAISRRASLIRIGSSRWQRWD